MATRKNFDIDGRTLSYLDFGGTGQPILALHGHMSEAASFTEFAASLSAEWRLIALDQRGHGHSDRAAEYSRRGYVGDIVALLDHLGLDSVVVVGHSLGGINAYQLAAWFPERVRAFVDADGAAALGLDGGNPLEFVLQLPHEGSSRDGLLAEMGPFAGHFGALVRERADGSWGLPFHPADMVESEHLVHGDHWAEWLGSSCPALLIRATEGVISAEQAADMVARRPRTRMVELHTDHFVYVADPAGFAKAVAEFLTELV